MSRVEIATADNGAASRDRGFSVTVAQIYLYGIVALIRLLDIPRPLANEFVSSPPLAVPGQSGSMGSGCSKTPHTKSGVTIRDPQAAAKLNETPFAAAASAASNGVNKNVATQQRDPSAQVKDLYKFGKTLGQGGFATVKLVTDKQTGEQFACKIMDLPAEGAEVAPEDFTREDIFKEIDILLGLQHENVMYMKEYFVADDKVYLICELLTGGELLDAVLERGNYSEADARMCFAQLLRGLQYLHQRGVVHRDLKLENLLLSSQDDIGKGVKIADFGLAKNQASGTLRTVCGTPQYVAPEVINGGPGHKYGPEVDLWSAGVVLFILLAGYPPFYNENEPQLFNQIRRGEYSFNDAVWDGVTGDAKDLIRQLLQVDPTKRLSAQQALSHKWMDNRKVSNQALTTTRKNLYQHKQSMRI